MKTTIHNHLRGQNGCLGFYYGLASLLSAYPEGGLPGEFFINAIARIFRLLLLSDCRFD